MRHVSKLVVIVTLALNASVAFAEKPEGVTKLLNDTSGNAQISLDKNTGNARFIRLPSNSQLSSLRTSRSRTPQSTSDSTKAFLRSYGSAFGVKDVESELSLVATTRDMAGSEHLTFKQLYQGLPVFAGELRAHFNNQGELIVVNGNFLSDIKVSTQAKLSPGLAAKKAIFWLSRDPSQALTPETLSMGNKEQLLKPGSPLSAKTITLMVFRAGMLKGAPGMDHLVYEVEVGNTEGSVREFVYVDAHTSEVVDQITGIHEALNRRAFDAEGQTQPGPNYPGSPFWVEGDALPTTSIEADNMIYASADSYSFFFNAFGRDSFDNAGSTMDAIFNRGDECPNASWGGAYISFCPGLTSDDVTAHEWSHAYTEYTNNLIYQWQSGALNEAYSDIWGETIDRINGRDDLVFPDTARTNGSCSIYGAGSPSVDDSARWLMGEDTSGFGGAIRDMWNPTCFGDPGKVSDSQYYCASTDSGGVHTNSGVPNHVYALMVDGGSYNGYSGTGLGLTKAAHIHWVAQNLLTSSSNFADHADALEAACSSLTGVDLAGLTDGQPTGEIITAGNCQEVADIIEAAELRSPPEQCGFEPLLAAEAPALCENMGDVQTFFSEDFENNAIPEGWTVSQYDIADPDTFDSPGWDVVGNLPNGSSGNFAAFAPDLIAGNCSTDSEAGVITLESPVIALPVGEIPHIAFTHFVATEAGWDGGNLKISINGGPFTLVPASAYSFNAYNSSLQTVASGNDNPLAGQAAFTGTNEGELTGSWGQSQINLVALAAPGDNIKLRFDFGTDGCNGVTGWYVDSIQAYSCSAELPPVCGDGELNGVEMCDDGNSESGDGCSSSCQVESGFVCTSPMPASNSSNIIADWSFEGGVPNADWLTSSSFSGVPGFPLCGPGNGCPAASLATTGSWLVWIGGIAGGVTSNIEQDITIPASATELSVQILRGLCAAPEDTLHISIDGTDIGTLSCDTLDGNFVKQTYSTAPFNDGGIHTLNIGGTVGNAAGHTNFFVDDVVMEDHVFRPATPSVCTPVVTEVACNSTVDFTGGIAPSWTVVDNAGEGIIWTTIADSGIGGNFTGGAGEAASANSDALPGEFDTELQSNSFSLAGWTSAKLEYLVNYQNVSGLDFLNLDISTDGGSSWASLLSWNEDHPVGGLFVSPGEQVSIDLSAYAGETDLKLRWHYFDPNSDDWDWYAQIDNVSLSCENVPQTMQCDINLDGFVDRNDIRLITAARNQPAQPGDPRDNDGNGVINASDARQCAILCTLPQCAPRAVP